MATWEIFAHENGVEIERHGGYWAFVPNRNPGRPSKQKPVWEPPNPLDIMKQCGIHVTRLTLGGNEVRMVEMAS